MMRYVEGVSQPLTPADLIYSRQIVNTANGCHFEVISTVQSLTKRARYQARLLTQFTWCWRRDYLLGLRESAQKAHRNQRVTPPIQAGNIVILQDDLTARCWWRLARVIELLKGRDDEVRAAQIQILSGGKNTILRRPIQLLIPLEVKTKHFFDYRGNQPLEV